MFYCRECGEKNSWPTKTTTPMSIGSCEVCERFHGPCFDMPSLNLPSTGPEDSNEDYYMRGSRAAWSTMLQQCITHLGYTGRTLESLILEREAAVAALRSICEDYGDNDWPDNLHLADVIEKHLGRVLDEQE